MSTTAADGKTLVQELFVSQDYTAVLAALQAHAGELPAHAIGKRILEAVATLDELAARTRTTVQQMLAFLPRLETVVLPSSYQAMLGELDAAIAPARNPAELIEALKQLRTDHVHEAVPGFAAGVRAAVDMLTDALETAHGGALGIKRPTDVAKACARAAVEGGMTGALSGTGPIVGAVIGGVTGSLQAALA